MKLLLLRHGENEFNRQRIVCGRIDPLMNRHGIAQVRRLARFLKREKIDHLYSSPMRRTRQTASIIFGRKKCILKPELREIDFGEWEGLPLKKIAAQHPRHYQKWLTHPEEIKFPKGESTRQLKSRVMKFVNKLARQYNNRDKTIALVTHGIPIKIIVCEFLGIGFKGFWRFHPELASVTHLEISSRRTMLVSQPLP